MSDEERFVLYQKKYQDTLKSGIKNGLVKPYDFKLIEKLRHIYCGGLPASILLLHEKFSNGHCYDRARLITLGFEGDEFRVVSANINSLRLNPTCISDYQTDKKTVHFNHCFAERTLKDGSVWVYDTSVGFVFEKNLYYELEKPEITNVFNKEQVSSYLYYDFQKDTNMETEKYALPLIIPSIESCMEPVQYFYLEWLQEEVKTLKDELDYNSICEEFFSDMKEKIGIQL